jgi:hypothetical protein
MPVLIVFAYLSKLAAFGAKRCISKKRAGIARPLLEKL